MLPSDDRATTVRAWLAHGAREEVDELRRRIATLEDRECILATLNRYGIAADTGDVEQAAACYTENTTLDYGADMTLYGRDGVRQMLLGSIHQSHLPRCAHTGGRFDITVDGDVAAATGYYRTYVRGPAGNELWRLSITRFDMVRAGSAWLIARRVSWEVGDPMGQAVLRGQI